MPEGPIISDRSRALRSPGGLGGGLLLVAVLVYALNLRGPFVALAPVVDDVARGLDVTPETVGLLTGIPVLCFALVAPLASLLLGRVGLEKAISLSLAVVFLGTVLRSSGGFGVAIAGTILIGAAITVGNVCVPVLVRRDFAQSAGTATGLYTAALNLGSVLTTVLTAPLTAAVGWRWALASWATLMVVAAVVWRRATADRPTTTVSLVKARVATDPGPSAVWGRAVAWFLTIAFASQSFSYYAVTTWLPTLLGDLRGMSVGSAGGAASLFQLAGMIGGVGVPLLVARKMSLRAIFAAMSVLWLSLPLGLLLAPELWPVWALTAGISQGGNFTVLFTLIVHHSRGQNEARRMSAMVQGVGYSAAAAGPFLLGAVHTASGGWTVPLLVVLGALVLMTTAGLLAASVPRATPPVETIRAG